MVRYKVKIPRVTNSRQRGVPFITIGDDAQPNYTNEFIRQGVGILANQTNATIYNAEFKDLTGAPSPNSNRNIGVLGVGAAINTFGLTVGSTGPNQENLFDNCDIGILVDRNMNLDARENMFTNIVRNGILARQNTSGLINIVGNDIQSSSGFIGFYCLDNSATTVNINNNNINWNYSPSQAGLLTGIAIQNVVPLNLGNNNISNVSINRIKNCELGVFVGSNPLTDINGNIIRIQKSNSDIAQTLYTGIRVVNSLGTTISANQVTKLIGNATSAIEDNLYGIQVENSRFTPTYNNLLQRMGRGIQYSGSCLFSAIQCNTMWKNWTGMNFNSADISQQGLPVGTFGFPNGLTWDNKWQSHQGTDRSDGLMATPTNIHHKPQNTYNPQPSTGLDNSGFNPVQLGNNSASNCAGVGTNPGGHVAPGQDKRNLLFAPIKDDTKVYGQYSGALREWDRRVLYAMFRTDNTWMNLGSSDDADYQQYYNSFSGSNTEKLCDMVDAFNTNNTALAASINASIVPDNMQEDYLKQVMDIYAVTFTDSIYTFTPQQQADLEFIACLDATEYGPGVYSAQAMLGLFYGCDGQGNMRSMTFSEPNTTKQAEIALYPNPNSGIFTIESELERASQLLIFDVTGKQVYSAQILKGYQINEFDLSNLNTGLYVVKIMSNGLTLKTERLVINK